MCELNEKLYSPSHIDVIFSILVGYGAILFIWLAIKPIYKTIHKKDFIRYWGVCSIAYWILTIVLWKIYKFFKLDALIFEVWALSIVFCIVSVVYFMVFRFLSHQEIIKESLSKKEKIGIILASFIHFLISPILTIPIVIILSEAIREC